MLKFSILLYLLLFTFFCNSQANSILNLSNPQKLKVSIYLNNINKNDKDENFKVISLLDSFAVVNIPSQYKKISLIAIAESYKVYNVTLDFSRKNEITHTLNLEPKIDVLIEINVKGKYQRYKVDGDTLKIKIKADDTVPHGNAKTLFDKVPGLQDNNGQLSILGKNIKGATIDGKAFYGGESGKVLNAIKANMIEEMELPGLSNDKDAILNIKLKSDKKNGIYGNLDVGLGLVNRFKLNGLASKISEKNFQNFTIQNNNFAATPSDFISNYSRLMQGKIQSSIMDSYLNNLMENPLHFESLRFQFSTPNEVFKNQTHFANQEFTNSEKNIELNINSSFGKIIENTQKEGFSEQLIGDVLTNENYINSLKINQNVFQNNFTYKNENIKKGLFIVANKFNFLDVKSKNEFTSQKTFSGVNNGLFQQKNAIQKIEEAVENQFKIRFTKIGKKGSNVNSIQLESKIHLPQESNRLNSENKNFNLYRENASKISILDHYITLNSSLKITRRWLGELRQSFENQQYNQKQKWLKNNNLAVNINQNTSQTKLILFNNAAKFQAFYELNWYKVFQNRQQSAKSSYIENESYLLPAFYLNFKINQKYTNTFSLGKEINQPQMNILGELVDSMDRFSFRVNNINLRNIKSDFFRINQTINFSAKFRISANHSFQKNQNPIVSTSELNSQTGFSTYSYNNGIESNQNWNSNLTSQFYHSRLLNLYVNANYRTDKSYFIQNGKKNNTENQSFYYRLSYKLNFSKKLLFNINVEQSSFSTNKFKNKSTVYRPKISYKIFKENYLDLTYNLTRFKNTSSQKNNGIKLLDLTFSGYLGKNNAIKIGARGQNLLNQKTINMVMINDNAQSYRTTNLMPRVLLVDFVYNFEKFKK